MRERRFKVLRAAVAFVMSVSTFASGASAQALDPTNAIDCTVASAFFEQAFHQNGDAHNEMVSRTVNRWYASLMRNAVVEHKLTMAQSKQRFDWAVNVVNRSLPQTKILAAKCADRVRQDPAFLRVASELSGRRTVNR